MIMALLFEAIEIDVPTEPNQCAIRTAVRNSDLAAAKKLLTPGATADYMKDGAPVLHLACSAGDLGLVKLLIDRGVAPDAKDEAGKTAAEYAREGDHANVAHYLEDIGKTSGNSADKASTDP